MSGLAYEITSEVDSMTDRAVATCSADQRIKIFRKNIDGQWEPETEWKVGVPLLPHELD